MRTHVEFRSGAFPPYEGEEEEINPGRYGKRLADFLAASLPAYGFEVCSVDAEDWGWRVELVNKSFPLWIGCGNYEDLENGFLCFIEPSKPFIRKWLSKVSTVNVVESLATAIETSLLRGGEVSDLKWWA
jgi:hypothetical protein